ncbi:hypothetical protein GIS00_13740 [Nakamurella sp. YIM 132087]|uniref:Uncharacterized protein n=1 Tax=Nakamurella alba TaxID=2665158 RepID=A0A7K1FLH6_9ACTN|nr:hypothetical protein [Nakamurella alba]MTD15001.1 hypothetical protein [Nakamurella alba]
MTGGHAPAGPDPQRLRPVADAADAAWIAERLGTSWGTVGHVVPQGFQAYARITHPVQREADELSWQHVCAVTGRTAHPLMQWQSIAAPDADGRRLWTDDVPMIGSLESPSLGRLADVLAAHTAAVDDCRFGLWDGYGWMHGPFSIVMVGPGPQPPIPPAFGPHGPGGTADAEGPMLHLPHRDYHLFDGPLGVLHEQRFWPTIREFDEVMAVWTTPQSPNLLWPADRSWCVATEIDFDSTLVGGPAALINDLLYGSSGLETWPVRPEDDLSINGDTIN